MSNKNRNRGENAATAEKPQENAAPAGNNNGAESPLAAMLARLESNPGALQALEKVAGLMASSEDAAETLAKAADREAQKAAAKRKAAMQLEVKALVADALTAGLVPTEDDSDETRERKNATREMLAESGLRFDVRVNDEGKPHVEIRGMMRGTGSGGGGGKTKVTIDGTEYASITDACIAVADHASRGKHWCREEIDRAGKNDGLTIQFA